ncbi:ribose-phosphate diphosphokinase [Candidatus Dojkabacteria bacterium]|nr:ribose-phosphate diphosphokinase [Candidatus Dojkabacteria bacterium]
MSDNQIILTGNSNISLAKKISKSSGVKLADITISKFPCSETRIHIREDLHKNDVYILQSISDPTNDHLMELALIADAAKRMRPHRITAVVPWFAYSPQDKIFRKGEPLSSQVAVEFLENCGIDRFIVVDIHSKLVLEKFTKNVVNLSAMEVFVDYIKEQVYDDDENWIVASLDKGGTSAAIKFAQALKLNLVGFDKSRNKETGKVTFHKLEGEVKDKNVVIFDDYVSTGGTLVKSAEYLKRTGAKKYWCCVTHVIVEKTLKKLENSKIDKFLTTNSIDFNNKQKYQKTTVLNISDYISKKIFK